MAKEAVVTLDFQLVLLQRHSELFQLDDSGWDGSRDCCDRPHRPRDHFRCTLEFPAWGTFPIRQQLIRSCGLYPNYSAECMSVRWHSVCKTQDEEVGSEVPISIPQ